MEQEVFIAIISGLFPIISFIYLNFRKNSSFYLIFAFVVFSLFSDSCNFYLFLKNENNLFVINTYDYVAITLEISFLLSIAKYTRIFRKISWLIIVVFWIAHAVFNYNNGFFVTSSSLSFILSLVVSVYAAIAALRILNDRSEDFNKKKYLLIPIMGFFIFETSCLIPVCTVNLNLTKEEDAFLSELYNHVIVIGTILRNLLFTIYFIVARNNQRDSSNLNSINQ